MQTHTTTEVHTWSHTHTHIYTESQSLSHTQTDTEQYTVTQREKQTHTVAHRPLEIQNNGRIVWAGSSWGERSRSVDAGGCGGCCTTPTHPRSIPSLFPLPEAEFSWDLDLLRDSALRCPLLSLLPCLVGEAGLPCGPASFWGSGDLGSFSPRWLPSPPGIILTMCHSSPPEQSLETGDLGILTSDSNPSRTHTAFV